MTKTKFYIDFGEGEFAGPYETYYSAVKAVKLQQSTEFALKPIGIWRIRIK